MRFLPTVRARKHIFAGGVMAFCLAAAPAPGRAQAAAVGDPHRVALPAAVGLELSFAPRVADGMLLTVAGPGLHTTLEFPSGAPPTFVMVGPLGPLPDGRYKYELRTQPQVDQRLREIASENDDEALIRALAREEDARTLVQAGRFEVRGGSIVLPQPAIKTQAAAAVHEHGSDTQVHEH